jgi:hypothetical protein
VTQPKGVTKTKTQQPTQRQRRGSVSQPFKTTNNKKGKKLAKHVQQINPQQLHRAKIFQPPTPFVHMSNQIAVFSISGFTNRLNTARK